MKLKFPCGQKLLRSISISNVLTIFRGQLYTLASKCVYGDIGSDPTKKEITIGKDKLCFRLKMYHVLHFQFVIQD